MIEIWMRNHLVSDDNCNIVKFVVPRKSFKEWQTKLGLHIVLMTLHANILQLVLKWNEMKRNKIVF